MRLFSPTQYKRVNEALGLLLLSAGLVALLSLVSYHVQDPSWDTATSGRPLNLVGYPGAYLADFLLQLIGAASYLLPFILFLLAWRWIRSQVVVAGWVRLLGTTLLTLSLCTAFSFVPVRLYSGCIPLGGTLGLALARTLVDSLNLAGSLVVTGTALVVSLYLVSAFSLGHFAIWFAGPIGWFHRHTEGWRAWRASRRERAAEKARLRLEARRQKEEARAEREATRTAERAARKRGKTAIVDADPAPLAEPPVARPTADTAPWETAERAREATIEQVPEVVEEDEGVPICPIEERPEPEALPQAPAFTREAEAPAFHPVFQMPSTGLLNEPEARSVYDEQELQDTAARIKAKFQEFNVLGTVVQINPGPVVTTFEFKPDAGIKYSRIINLREDLCLALQAESILIERIPGKPTVGIEVPNKKRETIALRQVLESDEFAQSHSNLTIPLGKDINGRIRTTALEAMPHLLIAGSTGSGKSVMINSMIMSILYKATPDDVRFIMVDPKRVELGIYEGIPHLLTPVIIDPKKAANALRNAVLEMERRLRLLAEFGVRNIDQFNQKVRKLADQPRELFPESQDATQEDLRPLPYIMLLIDELADLMMIEGRNVEESVARLAQMARAVGMHLVLATQRPSVDVITGLIKANFPARISFRVATRVDSRTILDVMGAEHLLGRGDMLFLPPGSGRLSRFHGSFVTESEIGRVVDFWKAQAAPEYDQSFLAAPPTEEETEAAGADSSANDHDPLYDDAVRLVLQVGKASTSTLQRHLRLGYGRAARILDMMQRDGIIGPPDGSKPRDVLKRPDWLREVDEGLR
jgi:DNA segregation ATPase FtsK/SpoIIIE, S-DNA-T family